MKSNKVPILCATVFGLLSASFALAGGYVSSGVTSFSGLTGAITSAQMIDPYVPVDGTMNVTGNVTLSASSIYYVGAGNVTGTEVSSDGSTSYGFGGNAGLPAFRTSSGFVTEGDGVNTNPTSLVGQTETSHLAGGSGAPTSPTAGTGCGTASAAANAGSDLAGHIDVKCGSSGSTGNPIITITFAHAYFTAPICVISPANAATIPALVSSDEYPVSTTTTLAIQCGGGTCVNGGASLLSWNYHCAQ